MKMFKINDLLKYSGEEFIIKIYQAILERDPDLEGLTHFGDLLRNGFSKEYVLYSIITSDEAKEKRIKIDGVEQLKKADSFEKPKNIFLKVRTWVQNMFNLSKKIDKIYTKIEKVELTIQQLKKTSPVVYVADNIVLANIQGFIMALPAEDLSVLAQLIYYGNLEPGLENAFNQYVKRRMTVIDIGAHIGLYTLLAGRLVGIEGKVYAFEPNLRIFNLLTRNVNINFFTDLKRICCEQLAVSDKKGKAKLFISQQKTGHGSLYDLNQKSDYITVKTMGLDQYFNKNEKIDVVKIDAEGAEPFIIRGMKRIIERNPQIIIFLEFCPENLNRASVRPRNFIRELKKLGFTLKLVDGVSGEIRTMAENKLLNCFSENLILTKEKS
jgi:FkbM family methyltransferase